MSLVVRSPLHESVVVDERFDGVWTAEIVDAYVLWLVGENESIYVGLCVVQVFFCTLQVLPTKIKDLPEDELLQALKRWPAHKKWIR